MPTPNHSVAHIPLSRGSRPIMRRAGRERRDHASRDQLVQRVVAEFREMPCLRLTAPQAQRLFGLRSDVSARIISQLVEDGVLRLDPDGRYAARP
jgi:hypothetical protein